MRNILAFFGAFALGFIAVSIALFVWGAVRSQPLIEQATAYADESIQAVATEWNGDEFSSRAAPELAALFAAPGAVDRLMSDGRRLVGDMIDYGGAECEMAQHMLSTEQGEIFIAGCTASARHERTTAQFQVNVLKRGGEWKLLGFFVAPDNAGSGPVQVDYQSGEQRDAGVFQISVHDRTLGLIARPGNPAGARIDGAKIHNDLTPQN